MPQAPLTSKDASLFRTVLKCYETKQYKKGLKSAEQILRKNPKHGETLAMKGLITNSLGRTEEAFVIAKEALRQDMESHVCWHVYGLLYRSEKNFEESVKALKMALRFEPDSQQILRDLALMQIHLRDFSGYIESRKLIMQGRPQLRQNWTGLAIAHHLAGNYAEAENVLTKFEETLRDTLTGRWDIERSEADLYKNSVIAESGDIERALEHLETIAKASLDKIAILENRAEYLLKLGRLSDAEKAYRVLIDRNSEKRAYYAGLEKCLGEPEARKSLKPMYDEYAEKNPRSDAPRRIPLDFLEGDEFREAADVYLQKLLKKGVPSTFANIKALYADPAKRQTLFELVESYAAANQENETNGESGDNKPKPSDFKLWTLYFLAQHYDHYRTRDYEKAVKYIDQALEVSPKTVELHMTLARIYKHSGDLQRAMDKMNEARELDRSDRYINTKCAKYQLRNDHNDEALETMGLFTRTDAIGGPLGDLQEMQCVWFITEDGESYLRQGKIGLALKRFHSINKIFEDWVEDQFDFHSFSLRKGQVRAYIEMIRWEDNIRSHPFFSRAALGAIKTYLLLHSKPHLAHGSLSNGGTEGVDFEGLSSADRKKALKKAKREAQKAHDKAAEVAAKAKEDKAKNGQVAAPDSEAAKKEDDDPLGVMLAQTKEPLEQAQKFLTPLLEFSPKKIEAQCAGFEVYVRRRKWLLALKCLVAAKKLDPENPVVHEQTIRLRIIVDKLFNSEEQIKPPTKQILQSELEKIIPSDTNLTTYNNDFLARNKASPTHVHGAIRVQTLLTPDQPPEIAPEELLKTTECPNLKLKEALEGLDLLKDLVKNIQKDGEKQEDVVKEYCKKVAEKFPEATAFRFKS